MTELPTWKTWPLKNWRIANGFTTPEWQAYVEAINIQTTILTVGFMVVSFLLGTLVNKV